MSSNLTKILETREHQFFPFLILGENEPSWSSTLPTKNLSKSLSWVCFTYNKLFLRYFREEKEPISAKNVNFSEIFRFFDHNFF